MWRGGGNTEPQAVGRARAERETRAGHVQVCRASWVLGELWRAALILCLFFTRFECLET